jgi:hypothetical protein
LNFEPGTLNSATAARHLERRLENERLNFVCREAMRHFQQQQTTVTHKKGERGDKKFDETTERHHPPSIQCLKVVLQASAQLNRLASQPPPEEQQPPTNEQRRVEVETWFIEQRKDAERAGKIKCDSNEHIVVRDFVSSLLGEPNRGLALAILARDAGKKVVDRKPYDDSPPQVPPQNGWYYPVYDYNGGLVAWLSEEQMAAATLASGVDMSSLEPAVAVTGCPPSGPENTRSSTCAPPADSSQVESEKGITPPPAAPQISPPKAVHVIHLIPQATEYA